MRDELVWKLNERIEELEEALEACEQFLLWVWDPQGQSHKSGNRIMVLEKVRQVLGTDHTEKWPELDMQDFEQLNDLANRLQNSGADDDAVLVRQAIKGLADMTVGAERLITIAKALQDLSKQKGQERWLVLSEAAREWGARLREMAVSGNYHYNEHVGSFWDADDDSSKTGDNQALIDQLCAITPMVGCPWQDLEKIAEAWIERPLSNGKLTHRDIGVLWGLMIEAGYSFVKVGPT